MRDVAEHLARWTAAGRLSATATVVAAADVPELLAASGFRSGGGERRFERRDDTPGAPSRRLRITISGGRAVVDLEAFTT